MRSESVLTFSYRSRRHCNNNRGNRIGATKHGFGFKIIAYRRIDHNVDSYGIKHLFYSYLTTMIASLSATIANVNCDREVFALLDESTPYSSDIWRSLLATGNHRQSDDMELLREYLLNRLLSDPNCIVELIPSITDSISAPLLAVLIWNSSAKNDIIAYINGSSSMSDEFASICRQLASFTFQLSGERRKQWTTIDDMTMRARLLIENAPPMHRSTAELQTIMRIMVDANYETLAINEACVNLQV